MAQSSIDLTGIFQSVTEALAENRQALNQADEYNRNHGDNMVQTFQTITRALQQKKSSSDSAALAYAAKKVAAGANSGSSQLYAENLNRAAKQFKGQPVNAQGALQLLQTLIGGGAGPTQASSGGGDMLSTLLGGMTGAESAQPAQMDQPGGDVFGSLLGGLVGGGETPSQPQAQTLSGSGDLLGSLLGGLAGAAGQPSQTAQQGGGDLLGSLLGGLSGGQGGANMASLLSAGMAYLQARQSGGSNLQALVQAFMAYSGMGNATHRTESTQVVVQSFLQALNAQP